MTSSNASAPPVVLVVEDDELIRLNAVDLIECAGFDVIEANDADEAIGILLARADIAVVFTDIDMPGSMDGTKLAHYVRNRWPPVKLIVASGKAVVEESHLPAGARFFPKPYDCGAIVEAMTRMSPGPYGEHADLSL